VYWDLRRTEGGRMTSELEIFSEELEAEPILPGINPAIDQPIQNAKPLPFTVACIGASAGGIEAISRLLQYIPPDTGIAFVVILHMAPERKSKLTSILGRATAMPVHQAEHNQPVEPNHVYVIPPGKDMVIADGLLKLSPRPEFHGQHRPIDHFLRSLAQALNQRAIGVILSGTASDGTQGLSEIKVAAGITFAQDDSAEYSGMPRSAVAAGGVDFVMAPEEIGREIGRISRHPNMAVYTQERGVPSQEQDIAPILELLHEHMGMDFTHYKQSTLRRRIERRMVLLKLDKLADYIEQLRADTTEVAALYNDILINVTSFFRNPEAYEALKDNIFPKLAAQKSRNEQIRVWTLGCATGEEAYSLAIAYVEFAEKADCHVPLQIFASDLNSAGIDRARLGIYPKGIAQDVSEQRLQRFFVEVNGSYRICKSIRDMCVFAQQNVLADPPFSRMDMISCRNMMIYLDPVLQQQLLPILHYALRPHGYLWLGSSETITAYRDIFSVEDAKNRIYARKQTLGKTAIELPLGTRLLNYQQFQRSQRTHGETSLMDPQREADRIVLARYAPPGVILDGNFDIVQFRGDTARYLAPAPGRASLHLLKMLREGLLLPVRNALHKAQREGSPVREDGLRVEEDGSLREVNIEVIPLKYNSLQESYLLLFEEPADHLPRNDRSAPAQPGEVDNRREVAHLKHELEATRDYLQSVIEQQEAINEELQSANEEVQSSNEELQSINEELETTKEEIQSSNEELATVNEELQIRNNELFRTNNDLNNLLSSVQMAILMLGSDLRIRWFTPTAEKMLNLIASDVARPIGNLNPALHGVDLEALASTVINAVAVQEQHVQDKNGHWYLLRIRPYQTSENKIEGAVVVLIDIDALKRGEQVLRESEARFQMLADSAPTLIWITGLQGCQYVNRAYRDFLGVEEEDVRGFEWANFVHPDDRGATLAAYLEAFNSRTRFETQFRFRRADGEYRWMKAVALPRLVGHEFIGYAGCKFDISDFKQAEHALLEAARGKNEFLALLAHELRNPLAAVRNSAQIMVRPDMDTNTVHQAHAVLDVSRITHGTIMLRRETIDLVQVLQHVVAATAFERQSRQQQLTLALPNNEMLWVNADPARLDQLFTNLLSNASKFTHSGGRIWVTVERELAAADSAAMDCGVVRIRDDGMGIERHLLQHVFDLFAQSERARGRAHSGMGLGLALAKKLVELHGGDIKAFSEGRSLGSEFIVRLPLLDCDTTLEMAPEPYRGARREYRILIVDDNQDGANALTALLKAADYDARCAYEGNTGLELARQFLPEVVLLDIDLPGLNGYQIATELRSDERFNETLLIALTGFGMPEDIQKSIAAGFDEHLNKPLELNVLEEIIRKYNPA
jgi:two-component system, chemotaxis family, CheB/CheR fusion protein